MHRTLQLLFDITCIGVTVTPCPCALHVFLKLGIEPLYFRTKPLLGRKGKPLTMSATTTTLLNEREESTTSSSATKKTSDAGSSSSTTGSTTLLPAEDGGTGNNDTGTTQQRAEMKTKEAPSALDAMKQLHEAIKQGPDMKLPLAGEVQELRDEFWSKYTPVNIRLLLLADQNKRVKNVLVLVSALLFTLPVGAMYLSHSLLNKYTQMDPDTTWICAALIAIFAVNLILGVFCYVAYCDEKKNWEEKQQLRDVEMDKWENRKKK
ncbi:unnamed protein product [Amoebophrya sp. A120]|nr:unnamed protein product [Amoebophrya sp. A120]|eukprot:GSA120T00024097001.1